MKILHLEDNPHDAELVREILSSEFTDCFISVVETRADFLQLLQLGGYDLILSDYQLPGFNGLDALHLAREQAPDVPFVFLSGTLGEEAAIDAVRSGASDYVVKDRMQRLLVSIQRALRESAEQRERRRVEQELAQEQYLQRLLMENLPDLVYFKDLHSAFIAASHSLARRVGLQPGQIRGRSDFDFFAPEYARQTFDEEQRIIRTGEPKLNYEQREVWPDGTVTWALSSKMPLREPSGTIVGTFGISRDITERKRAEDRIREQAEIIDHAPLAIVITDLEHRITYGNSAARTLYQASREEMLGHTAEDLFTPETIDHLAPGRDATLVSGQWTGLVPVETRTGKKLQAEFHMSLIKDAAGHPRARLSIAIDVTEKKKLEEQFLRAQRLESLGMLAAGIAHDLNNVLAPVLMGAPLLRTHAMQPADLRVLEAIESSAGRGAALVRQILSFANGAESDKMLIQAKHLVQDIAKLVAQTFPRNIRLEEDLQPNLWPILGNATQLHQIVLNLCVNARDAMPGGGTLRLHLENRTLTAAQAQAWPEAHPGSYVVIEVADTGTGIPPAILERIWEPFFTTKGEGKGTGLGLATVRGIATSHNGFVTLDTAEGRGTTFRVFLPAAENAGAAQHGGTRPNFLMRGRGELVLVVDDEKTVRELVGAILSRFGYRVLAAVNGMQALALYASRIKEVALLISDLGMPEMGGTKLAAALTQLNPELRVIFISGGELASGLEPAPDGAMLLPKPFSGEDLLSRVHEALETPHARG